MSTRTTAEDDTHVRAIDRANVASDARAVRRVLVLVADGMNIPTTSPCVLARRRRQFGARAGLVPRGGVHEGYSHRSWS